MQPVAHNHVSSVAASAWSAIVRLDAVRGHLYEMAGDPERAVAHYRAAAERTTSIPERNYLTTKAARLAAEQRKVSAPTASVDMPNA